MASVVQPLRMLAAILVVAMTSSVSSEPNLYDRACFVPPSKRISNVDQLVLVEVSLPAYQGDHSYSYLAIPNGTCGIDIYYHKPNLYLPIQFRSYIESTAAKFNQYCSQNYAGSNQTVHPWNFTVLTTGGGQIPLVPSEELTPVPIEWRDDIVIRARNDYLASRQLDMYCNVSPFKPVGSSQYNMNVTVRINGCPWGKYGSQCEQDCTCAAGVECHSFNGACMCPAGLRGARCDQREPQLTTQQQVYVPYGETVNLTCFADGMLPTSQSWSKDGCTTHLQISVQKMIVEYEPRPVVITTTVDAHDASVNGGYVCEIHDVNGAVLRQHVNVTVIAIPDPIVRPPQNHITITGSNVTFTCQIKTEAGTVRWVKGADQPPTKAAQIKDEVGQYEILRPSEGVYQLRIYNVDFVDEDAYRCYAGYVFHAPDLSYAEATLTVHSAPKPECSFQDVVNIQAGVPVTLWCFLERAKPVPTLTWAVVSREMTPELVIIRSNDSLAWNVNSSVTFVPTPEDDGKRIIITVASPAQTKTQELTALLNVTYMPVVIINPDPITLTVGQDATVRCDAHANPEPTHYLWTLGHPNKPASSTPFGTGTTYVFKDISRDYNKANLTCLVKNTVGETAMTVQIKVTDKISSTGVTVGLSVLGGLCLAVLVLASFLAHRYRREIKLWRAERANKDKGDKKYDVFVSYKSGTPDEEFVVRDLIPRLERDGYCVCVHYKAFLPGRSILDNIADAVHWSRKTLLLLSPGFVESEWCRYEFRTALTQMLHLQSDLIPVIFEDLGPMDNLDPDLQAILQSLSYITWPGAVQHGRYQTEQDRERFWKLLWQSLPETPLGCEEQVLENTLGREEHAIDNHLGREERAIDNHLGREEQVIETYLGSQGRCETSLSRDVHVDEECSDVNCNDYNAGLKGDEIFLLGI